MKLLVLLIVGTMAVGCAQTTKSKETTASAKTDTKKSSSTTATKSTSSSEKIECKSGSDVRVLEIKSANGSYEVVYTKLGEAKSIATGGKAHCEAIRDRVKGNLANAGFTCS
jgi:hypothetical protein